MSVVRRGNLIGSHLKLIFAGTPAFAVPTLQALIDSQHEILAVYTQPDRPAGRGRQMRASPVKELAQATYGKYYYYYDDAKELQNIRDDILKVPYNQYVIVYETAKNRNLIDSWREVEVNVNYQKLTGIDKTGYFIPNH